MGVPWGVALRAFAVQGSWNYETLTGTGFAFAILPALRRIYGDGDRLDRAVARHGATFNSHPYLMPLALGAVIRMEEDGEDPEVIGRFKAALRGSLGTLGDQLVWASWRPTCALLALVLLLIGVSWWVAVLVFLLLYNLGHVGLMMWGLRVGLREGRAVSEWLRSKHVRTAYARVSAAGAFLAGLAVVLLALRGLPLIGGRPEPVWIALAFAIAVPSALYGERARRVSVLGLVAVAGVGLLLGVV